LFFPLVSSYALSPYPIYTARISLFIAANHLPDRQKHEKRMTTGDGNDRAAPQLRESSTNRSHRHETQRRTGDGLPQKQFASSHRNGANLDEQKVYS
jgi:hypothetical protein